MRASERAAVAADAHARLVELRAQARDLWPHRDDAMALSELTGVLAQIRSISAHIEQEAGDAGA